MKTHLMHHTFFKLLPVMALCMTAYTAHAGSSSDSSSSSTGNSTWNCSPQGGIRGTGIVKIDNGNGKSKGHCPDGYEDYVKGSSSDSSKDSSDSKDSKDSSHAKDSTDTSTKTSDEKVDVTKLNSGQCDKATFEKVVKDIENKQSDKVQKEKVKKDGKDEEGRDKDGRDKDGFDKDGRDKEGRDKDGRDKEGYDKDGYDKNGYDKDGYDKHGKDKAAHHVTAKDQQDDQGNQCRHRGHQGPAQRFVR